MKYHVFLSYSHKDVDIMRRIRDDLRSSGLIVWNDENLVPGTHSWKKAIENAIENTANLIVVLSPAAKLSEWIERELEYATACGIPVIPVLANGDERNAVPFELINVQRVDIRANYDAGIQQLITTVRARFSEDQIPSPHDATQIPHKQRRPSGKLENQLDAWNVLDQLRLMWWLFMMPQRLVQYETEAGDKSVRNVATWLVSLLSWLPMGIPVLAYSLGTIQRSGSGRFNIFLALLLLIMAWFVTAWLADREDRRFGMVVLIVSTCISLVVFYLIGQVEGVELAVGVIDRANLVAALGVAIGVGFVIAANAVGIATGIIAGIVFSVAMLNRPVGLESGAIAALALVSVTLIVALTLQRSRNTGQLSVFNWVATALCVGIYGLMICIYFLGGWSILP
jgi:hypothetical protein